MTSPVFLEIHIIAIPTNARKIQTASLQLTFSLSKITAKILTNKGVVLKAKSVFELGMYFITMKIPDSFRQLRSIEL